MTARKRPAPRSKPAVGKVRAWAFVIGHPEGHVVGRCDTVSKKSAIEWRAKFAGPGYALGEIVPVLLPSPHPKSPNLAPKGAGKGRK